MELPFLKNKKNKQGGGIIVEKKADSGASAHLLSSITEELMEAIDKKDHRGLIDSLRAFVLMIKDEDEESDE
jgi:hypothetical protein